MRPGTPFLTWISSHMHSKVCDEITYLFQDFNNCIVGVRALISNFTAHRIMRTITFPYCGLGDPFAEIMYWCPFVAKPFSEPLFIYCQVQPQAQATVNCEISIAVNNFVGKMSAISVSSRRVEVGILIWYSRARVVMTGPLGMLHRTKALSIARDPCCIGQRLNRWHACWV